MTAKSKLSQGRSMSGGLCMVKKFLVWRLVQDYAEGVLVFVAKGEAFQDMNGYCSGGFYWTARLLA